MVDGRKESEGYVPKGFEDWLREQIVNKMQEDFDKHIESVWLQSFYVGVSSINCDGLFNFITPFEDGRRTEE